MSGRRIDDHSSWVGKGADGVVYPTGAKHKKEDDVEGAGGDFTYPDTAEDIRKSQKRAVSQLKGYSRNPMNRN